MQLSQSLRVMFHTHINFITVYLVFSVMVAPKILLLILKGPLEKNVSYNVNFGYTDDQGFVTGNGVIKSNIGMGVLQN